MLIVFPANESGLWALSLLSTVCYASPSRGRGSFFLSITFTWHPPPPPIRPCSILVFSLIDSQSTVNFLHSYLYYVGDCWSPLPLPLCDTPQNSSDLSPLSNQYWLLSHQLRVVFWVGSFVTPGGHPELTVSMNVHVTNQVSSIFVKISSHIPDFDLRERSWSVVGVPAWVATSTNSWESEKRVICKKRK